MPSKSFGEWYEDQKKEPTSLSSTKASSKSWFSSIFNSHGGDSTDVESVGLLSRARNVGSTISGVGDTMKQVMIFFGLAIVFFIIAYVIGLPTLLLRPAKFTISFTMGSLMTMLALATLQSPARFVNSIFQRDRILKTILYFLSLVMSILYAVVWRSYIGTMVSSVLQIVMLALFVLESFPAGSHITSLFMLTIRKSFSVIYSIVSRFIR